MDLNLLSPQILRRTALSAATAFALLGVTGTAGAAVNVSTNNANEVNVSLTSGDNAIVSCSTGGMLRVNSTDYPTITCGAVEYLAVYGDGLSNTIDLTGVNAPAFSKAKLDGDIEIHGGFGGDMLTGSPLGDTIYASDGDDDINTGPDTSADDTVWPGNGDDTVASNGNGNDAVRDVGHSFVLKYDPNGGLYDSDLVATGTTWSDNIGGFDKFELSGTGGADTIDASQYKHGSVTLKGEDGGDTLIGPATVPAFSRVEIHGGPGADTITGGNVASSLYGDAGQDTIDGQGGDDDIQGGPDADTITGGAGDDDLLVNDLPATATITATSLTTPDATDTLGAGIDNIILRDSPSAGIPNSVDASGWTGKLRAHLEAGDDTLSVGPGGSIVFGDIGHDKITGGAGVDEVHGGGDQDTIDGGGEADVLYGDGEEDKLIANDGVADKTLDCGDAVDTLLSDDGETGTGCETVHHPQPPIEPIGDPQGPNNGNNGGNNQNPEAPKDVLAPKLTLGKATLKKGVYSIKVTCPAGEVSCAGTATLASLKKVGKKKVTFGKQAFNLAGGKSTTLKIKLSKKNLKLLKRHRKIAAQLRIDVRDAAGNRAAASARTTLKGGRR